MARSDNTRPIAVVQQDQSAQYFGVNSIVVTGGINSEAGHGKRRRNEATRRVRRHVRGVLRSALLLTHDPDLIDIPPTPANKRSVGWRYA